MRETAIIYTRVSTDEQNNGYSPADQKDKLYRYCESRNIEVVGFYHDDESGKSFDRPEWKKLKAYLKANKNQVNYIYFLKWDRFSRNATDAYAELSELKKLNVEARAMEQPLDLAIPEQKLLLALYLTAPEVDNDRRAMNIFHGMRRAKKEGRYLGNCPVGYINSRNQFNRPILTPEGGLKEALVKESFERFATGLYAIEDLRKYIANKGLKTSRNAFWKMLRNKLYIGMILVHAYKDEPEHWVKGQHEALIDEDIFYACQDIFEGRKRKIRVSFKTYRDEFPLRGHLICPQCGAVLTGSSSKGRSLYYDYYHCMHGCKERQPVKKVNDALLDLLKEFEFKPKRLELLSAIVKDTVAKDKKESKQQLELIHKRINKQNMRASNAKGMMLDGEISADEYKAIKIDIKTTIANLTREQSKYTRSVGQIDEKVNKSIAIISNLANLYQQRDITTKQRIIGSIFPEKLIYRENSVRTVKLNRVVALSLSIGKGSAELKKEKHTDFGVLSHRVESEGFEPLR